MNRFKQVRVVSLDGVKGMTDLSAAPPAEGENLGLIRVGMDDGREVWAPAYLLEAQEDGTYRLPVRLSDLEGAQGTTSGTGTYIVIPAIEEKLRVEKQVTEEGGVRVTKHVQTHEEVVDEPGSIEEVDVKRVPVNRKLENPAEPRQEGDTWIIPVMEEVLVIQKQYLLKEEIHITKKKHEVRNPKRVKLRRESVDVERLEGPPEGRQTNR